VGLHDVTPAFEADIRSQVDELQAIGISRFVFKVVPSWHGGHRLSDYPAFVAFLKSHMDTGSEMCLHGLEHAARGPLVAGSVAYRVRARLFAPQAAEFLTLSPNQARKAIDAGVAEFDRVSLGAPCTFCAPAWLMPPEYKGILRAAGISTYVGMYSVENLETGVRRHIPGFGFMGGSGLHELGIRSMNTMTRPLTRHANTIKVYLHPDTTGRGRWKPAVERLKVLTQGGGYRAETYSGIIGLGSRNYSA